MIGMISKNSKKMLNLLLFLILFLPFRSALFPLTSMSSFPSFSLPLRSLSLTSILFWSAFLPLSLKRILLPLENLLCLSKMYIFFVIFCLLFFFLSFFFLHFFYNPKNQDLQLFLVAIKKVNKEKKEELSLITLSQTLSTEINNIIRVIYSINSKIETLDLNVEKGQLTLIQFATVLVYLKKQLESKEILAPFEPKVFMLKKEQTTRKCQEMRQILQSLIFFVFQKLECLCDSIPEKTANELFNTGLVIRNIKGALFH